MDSSNGTPIHFDNRTANICLVAGHIGQNSGIIALHVVRVFMSLAAVAINCLLLFALVRHKALHFNLRLLLINLSISICLQRLLIVYLSFEFLIGATLFARDNPCLMVMTTLACWLRRFPQAVFTYSILLSSMSIAMERAYATWKFRTYEDIKSIVPCLLLISFQKLVAMAIPLARLSGLQPGNTPYCHSITVSLDITNVITAGTCLALEVTAACIYFLLLYINKRMQETTLINQALNSLATRYQLSENVRGTRMMIPSVIMHTVCWTALSIINIFVVALVGQPTSDSAIALFEGNGYFLLIYSLFHPIICFKRSPGLRNELIKRLPDAFTRTSKNGTTHLETSRKLQGVKNSVAPLQTQGAIHFETLEKAWQAAHFSHKKKLFMKTKSNQQLNEIQLEIKD